MKNYIKYLWQTSASNIIKNSFTDCHIPNVSCIEFTNKCRLFFAHDNHNLHYNIDFNNLSLPIHAHYVDTLCLSRVFGRATNIKFKEFQSNTERDGIKFNKYLYTEKGELEAKGIVYLKHESMKLISEFELMSFSELHTIHVPENTEAAWFVFEGKTNPDFKFNIYSTKPSHLITKEKLYNPIAFGTVEDILIKCNLI